MHKQTIIEKIKEWIGAIGWRLFLWGNQWTEDQYLKAIRNEFVCPHPSDKVYLYEGYYYCEECLGKWILKSK